MATAKTGESVNICGNYKCKNGNTLSADVIYSCVKLKGEKFLIASVFDINHLKKDISERIVAEEALKKNQTMFSVLFNKCAAPTVLTMLPDHRIIDVNDAWSSLFEYSKDEAIGKTPSNLKSLLMQIMRNDRPWI